jgi:hypothetical protein
MLVCNRSCHAVYFLRCERVTQQECVNRIVRRFGKGASKGVATGTEPAGEARRVEWRGCRACRILLKPGSEAIVIITPRSFVVEKRFL